MQAARGQQRQMLQIALTPSPVAGGEIQQRRRAFLETAAERGRHMDGPAATSHQRSLDEIVAQDMPAERLAPLQFGKPGVLRKRADPDDGVVSPVIAFGAMPPGDPGGDQRAVQPAGELLPSRKQGSGVDHDRQRLDQRDLRMFSIAATSRTMVSPVIRLSASRMSMQS